MGKAMRFSALVLLLVTYAANARSADWSMMRGSPDNRGVAAEALRPPLRRVWTFRAGGPVEGTAAIVGGVVYVGTQRGVLYALRLSDGKPIWKFQSQDAFTASPTVLDGTVYVGDEGGRFYAISASNGHRAGISAGTTRRR